MSVLLYGTPEYEAYQVTQAPHRAAAEARRVAREAERAEREARRAEIRAELDRIVSDIDKWSAEHEQHYQTMEAARLKHLRKNAAFDRAYKSYQAEKLSHPALVRSAIEAKAATDAYNALVPGYNARIAHNDLLWKNRLDTEKQLHSITPYP